MIVGIVVAAVVVVLVFVVAAVAIGREARRLDARPPSPVFDIDEAVAFVAEELPDAMTARLTFYDVRRLIEWHLEFLAEHGVKETDRAPVTVEAVVFDDEGAIDHALLEATAVEAGYAAEDIAQVHTATLRYFEAIGAVGPEASGDL